jgi:crossover junction endodeoxyribonuclease RuvC
VSLYLGADPGKSGAFAVIGPKGDHVSTIKLSETPHDVWAWLDGFRGDISFAVLERVASRPGQGVASTFTFGQSYGLCRAFLVAAAVRHELVTPAKWQRAMGCLSKGDKKVTKAKAQQLFPEIRVTHAIADALLLAEHARRLDTARVRG